MSTIERAILLREHRRYDESVAELTRLIAQDPEYAEGHAQLALTRLNMPDQRKEALASIDNAIALDAEDASYFAIKSLILSDMDRNKDALAVAEEAIQLEPSAFPWFAKAQALTGLKRWAEAETACEKTLSLDPDYHAAENLRAIVLRAQGKLDAADDSAIRRLSRNAEDPISLANAGWTALQRGDREKAEEMFRESLRIDPDNEYARDGLLEAFKSRSPAYRFYLQWVFFLQKYTAGKQLLIIIGLYVAYRVSTSILRERHTMATAAIVIAYLFFAFGSFVAPGLGHFLILKDPLARKSLNRRERLDGLTVGLLVILGLFGLVLGVSVLPSAVALCGGCFIAAAVPGALVFRNYSRIGQFLFAAVAGIAVVAGLLQIAEWAAPSDALSQIAGALFGLSILGVVLCTWLANVPGLVKLRDS